MKLDLTPLLGGEVDTIPIDYPLTIEGKIRGVAFPNPVRVLGTITDKAGYIALNAALDLSYDTVCDRCLAPIHRDEVLKVARTVALSGSLENEDQDDYLIAQGRMLELDEPFLEEIELNFPTKFLCNEDCRGLCPRCGRDLNKGACACETKQIDPRMAVFAKLLEKKDHKKDQT